MMEPQVLFGEWVQVETRDGTRWIDSEVVDRQVRLQVAVGIFNDDVREELEKFVEFEVLSATYIEGWGARMREWQSWDATDWAVFDTEDEAVLYIRDMYSWERCRECRSWLHIPPGAEESLQDLGWIESDDGDIFCSEGCALRAGFEVCDTCDIWVEKESGIWDGAKFYCSTECRE